MSTCTGSGECIQQCDDNKVGRDMKDIKIMDGGSMSFWRGKCDHNCSLVECHNFKLCGQKRPQILLDRHNGMCIICAMSVGKVKFLNEKDDCEICSKNKDMITVCRHKNHKVCMDCRKLSFGSKSTSSIIFCPLCSPVLLRNFYNHTR